MAGKSAASQAPSVKYCNQPAELVELCTEHCPYKDCVSDNGCPEYKTIQEALKMGADWLYPKAWQPGKPGKHVDSGQPYFDLAWEKLDRPAGPDGDDILYPSKSPAIMIEDGQPGEGKQLNRLNVAITALSRYLDDEGGIDWPTQGASAFSIKEVIGSLVNYRSQKYNHLVDWDAVATAAKGGNK